MILHNVLHVIIASDDEFLVQQLRRKVQKHITYDEKIYLKVIFYLLKK